ncbi:MAG: type III pantothenate kinase [Candidatus Cloacimonadales bacterium]
MVGKNLVADIGNTHIVIGIFAENKVMHSFRLSTDKLKTEDEYFTLIHNLCQSAGFDLKKIKNFALSSVVPKLTRSFCHLSEKYFQLSPIIVDAYLDLGLSFPMSDPGFIGADLIVNAFAACEKYQCNTIICDFGTATTLQLVGKDGFFHGTIIAPGVLTSAASLFSSASKLSQIQLTSPPHILGTNTADALKSGIINGNQLMIDAMIKQIKQEYPTLLPLKTVATGGIAQLICQNSSEIDLIDKNLTLEGLNLICNRVNNS